MIVSYKWLSEYFDKPLPEANELVGLLSLHSFEIEGVEEKGGDTLIDIDVLPNRAHDCLSHRGIAREIASILSVELKNDPLAGDLLSLPEEGIVAKVDAGIPNTSTIAILVKGVEIKESPQWLKERLEILGQRSINNVVDITNYVMLAMGQPLHAFDAKVFGEGVLRIKRAEEGEEITLLGDIEAKLSTEDLVVSNGKVALDVAGIRGGVDAEINTDTKDIVISASHFDATMVRKTAQRIKLWTDAAKRFQNDPSPYLAEYGARECLNMILELAGGEAVGMSRAGQALPAGQEVELSVARANAVLGLSLSGAEVVDILERLGAKCAGDDVLKVSVPFERMDLNIEEDLIEEIGRLYGYDKLPEMELPERAAQPVHKHFLVEEIIRNLLTEAGYCEVITYVLQDSGEVKLQNALTSEKDHLRTNLAKGLEGGVELNKPNLPLLGKEFVDIFEIGNVFTKDTEKTHLGIATNRKKKEKIFSELIAKLSEELGVEVKGRLTGNVYEIDLTEAYKTKKELELPAYSANNFKFKVPSTYPFVLRDLAAWVPEDYPQADFEKLIKDTAGELLYRLDSFDVFHKDERTSYAYHLVFQSSAETLTDEQVGKIMSAVEKALENKGFEIR